jgi:hypothetical protein
VRAIAVGRAKFGGSFRLLDALERYGESRLPAIVQWVRPPSVVGGGGTTGPGAGGAVSAAQKAIEEPIPS